MHACGHDGHTATLILVAHILHKMREHFSGKVKLIFQPAEEGGKGSLAMISEGVLNNVDAIFGYHNWPGLAIGKVGTRTGAILAGAGRFEITLNGKIAHTSMPQHAVNPVTIGAKIITALENLHRVYSSKSAIINIIRFESGEIKGGMTDSAKIIGVYYVESDETLAVIKSEIEQHTQAIAEKYGATHALNFYEFHTPTINTKKEADLVLETARDILKAQDVIEFPTCMTAAEDFSEYLRIVPGCFFLVGAGENTPPVHTAHFDFPDNIIPVAALIMATTAINFLNEQ
jgi:hippurate hydrolase